MAESKNKGFIEVSKGLFVDSRTIFERLKEIKAKENEQLTKWKEQQLTSEA